MATMPLGVETWEFIELPAVYRGLSEPAMGQVRWVDAVSGKAVVAIEGQGGEALYVPVEPEVLQASVENLTL